MTWRRVHARLDDLQGDRAADRLRLLGHEDDAHAPFADLLQELVRADHACRAVRRRLVERFAAGGRHVQKAAELLVFGQQRFDASAQSGVASAGLVEKGGPLGGIALVRAAVKISRSVMARRFRQLASISSA